MVVTRILGGVVLAVVLTLSGCGAGSKQDIMAKAQNCKTKEELQKALGKPNDFNSADVPLLGTVETWTYKASDGEVVFQIANGKVVMKVTGDAKKK